MKQIICDKCGTKLDEERDNELYFTEKRRTKAGYDNCINLCDNCLDKFHEWLNG